MYRSILSFVLSYELNFPRRFFLFYKVACYVERNMDDEMSKILFEMVQIPGINLLALSACFLWSEVLRAYVRHIM